MEICKYFYVMVFLCVCVFIFLKKEKCSQLLLILTENNKTRKKIVFTKIVQNRP